jgi:hypothetical protein
LSYFGFLQGAIRARQPPLASSIQTFKPPLKCLALPCPLRYPNPIGNQEDASQDESRHKMQRNSLAPFAFPPARQLHPFVRH